MGELKCTDCKKLLKEVEKLSENQKINLIKGSGSGKSGRMWVGEAPGADEALLGKPFIGRAGRYWEKQILNSSGIDRSKDRVENAVCCRPLHNRTPKDGEIANCRKHLIKAIDKYKPRLIFAMGAVAWKGLTNFSLGNLLKWQGNKVWSREFKCWIVPILHPSYLMRGINGRIVEYDVYNTMDYVDLHKDLVDVIPREPKVRKIYVDSDVKCKQLIDALFASDEFAVDIETDNINDEEEISDFLEDNIIGASFSYRKNEGYFVPYEFLEKYRDDFEKLFESDRMKILQNCSFDQKFLRRYGFILKGDIFDTLLAHHLIDENFAHLHSLNNITWRYTLHGGYDQALKVYKKKNKIKDYSKIPLDIMAPYACYDALVTFELKQIFVKLLEKDKLTDLFWKITMPTRYVLNNMEYNGVSLRVSVLKKMGVKLASDIKFFAGRIHRITKKFGYKDFNIKSPKQMRDLLFKKLKLVPIKFTKKTKAESVDEEVLNYYTGSHKVIDSILEYRKLSTYYSTFIDGMLKKISKKDGRLHTSYLSHGTVTGRLSSAGPNLQNIPSDRDIRSVFIPAKGYVFIDADYSQAELRVLAHYSQDPFMLEVFENDEDIHTMVGVEILDKLAEEISKAERKIVKEINFGIIYGRGAKSVAKKLGIPIERAQKFMRLYFQKFPKIKELIRWLIKYHKQYGYIENMFGRRRRIPAIEHDVDYIREEAQRQLINSLIQGTAVDITNMALCRIEKAFGKYKIKGYPALQVHDEIVGEVIYKQRKDAQDIMIEQMEKPIKGLTVGMKADSKICTEWGVEYESLGYVWRDVRKIK